ncbi:hypothetical protein U91I_02373 [alpha proteobacterium U9-1i]|nr:hypothetical protein U91I_02373 [alpha proteobacterium U9-1i]
MEAEIFVPFIFFAFLAAVILVPILSKERTKRSAHDLVSQAMARGQTLEPALIEKLSSEMLEEGDRARKSLGKGIILTMLAGGLLAAGYFGDGWDEGAYIPATIIGALGIAFLLLALIDYLGRNRA